MQCGKRPPGVCFVCVRVCVCAGGGGWGVSCYRGQYRCADQNGSTFDVAVSIRVDFKVFGIQEGQNI